MKAFSFSTTILVLGMAWWAACPVSGQVATNATAAAARPRPQPVRSPERTDDGRVTFRVRADQARDVLVNGQWPDGRAVLSRDTNGVWSVTVGPVPPGVWEYSLVVDGLTMIDPGNPAIKPMREPRTSILHVPSNPPAWHDYQDVPHGTVHTHNYFSKSLGRLRELAVYTPPGYGSGRRTRYPLLVLQHGSGDNQATWVAHGKAHWILDNLIAQQKAVPMVVLMLDGHAAAPGSGVNNVDAFERDLLEEALPLVEREYRVRTQAAQRALAGLSMGGGQALTTGLRHAGVFGWVAGFSSAPPSVEVVNAAVADPDALNRQLKLLWVACGKDDFLLQRNKEFVALLDSKGITHEWRLTEGNHSWPVWREYLAELAPKLFR